MHVQAEMNADKLSIGYFRSEIIHALRVFFQPILIFWSFIAGRSFVRGVISLITIAIAAYGVLAIYLLHSPASQRYALQPTLYLPVGSELARPDKNYRSADERTLSWWAGHNSSREKMDEKTVRHSMAIGPVSDELVDRDAPLDLSRQFADAVRRIETGQTSAINDLRKSARQGYAPAQFYLAKLYENGEGGVAKDRVEARRWTERAAQGGDRKAMHNLGLYYFEGTGGSKNLTAAALWFRRAADLGLTDSQFNLGKLYEEGLGVVQSNDEAYKWYLIAAKAGDEEARSSAERLRAVLSPQARTGVEQQATNYRPSAVILPITPVHAPAASTTRQMQRALSRLGYYHGPMDGESSPALDRAVKAYQRDQGLAVTGELDAQAAAVLMKYGE